MPVKMSTKIMFSIFFQIWEKIKNSILAPIFGGRNYLRQRFWTYQILSGPINSEIPAKYLFIRCLLFVLCCFFFCAKMGYAVSVRPNFFGKKSHIKAFCYAIILNGFYCIVVSQLNSLCAQLNMHESVWLNKTHRQ